jgi:hypothetical protein
VSSFRGPPQKAFDDRVLDRAVHPLHLAFGIRVVWLGQPVLFTDMSQKHHIIMLMPTPQAHIPPNFARSNLKSEIFQTFLQWGRSAKSSPKKWLKCDKNVLSIYY